LFKANVLANPVDPNRPIGYESHVRDAAKTHEIDRNLVQRVLSPQMTWHHR
jgi:hypothetical protein